MKILLNLLPEEKKLEIQRTLHGRFLLWQLFLLFLLELFLVGILVAVYFILSSQLKAVESTQAAGSRGPGMEEILLGRYEDKFRGINEAIDTVGRIEAGHLYFSQVFRLLDRAEPEGVTLDKITTTDRMVTLAGMAETREALLLFEERLKASDCIEKVETPLSNLFSEKDVEFQIDFTVTLACLHKNSL